MLNNPPTVKVKYKSRGNRIDFRIMNLSDYEAMAEKDRPALYDAPAPKAAAKKPTKK